MKIISLIQKKIYDGNQKFYKSTKDIIKHPKKDDFERTNKYVEEKLKQLANA